MEEDGIRHGAGRPTGYRPEYVRQAGKLYKLGATDREVADFFEVSLATISNWKTRYPEFMKASLILKEICDDRMERSLYHRGMGYEYETEKIYMVDGEERRVKYREHVPPEVGAIRLWLAARRPKVWRGLDKLEVSGANGSPLTVVNMTMTIEQAAAAYLDTLRSTEEFPAAAPVKQIGHGNGNGNGHAED